MEKSLIDTMWVITSAGLVFMMQAGFLCLESGLTRAKNAINVAIKNLSDFGISVVIFWMIGFGIMFGKSYGGWIGSDHFFTQFSTEEPFFSAFFLFQVMFCATAATIVSGAVAERFKFISYLIATAIITGIIYPVFGHWAWKGILTGGAGWLAEKGFVDFAGSTVVHSVGGWVAFAALIVVGPRIGRFLPDGTSQKIPGSNLPLAMLGILLLFFGWIGFNGGSTLSFDHQVPKIIVNTVLAGASGSVVSLIIGWKLRKLPDISLPMNGALGGLVAVTANCHAVSANSAVIIGSIAGIVVIFGEYILEKLRIDDVVSAVPVHLFCGIWGTVCVAIFGQQEILQSGLSRWGQFQIQLLGIAVCFIYSFSIAYILLKIIDRFMPLRVSAKDEVKGLNVSEHKQTTELIDLLLAMDQQEQKKDFSTKVVEEPFTEVGQIAKKYNSVLNTMMKAVSKTQTIVTTIRDGLFTVTAEGKISSFNPGAEKIFGFTAKEVIGKPLSTLFKSATGHKKDGREISLQDSLENFELNEEFEFEGRRKDGYIFPAEMVVNKGYIGEDVVYTGIIRDITKMKTMVDDLKANEEALRGMLLDLKTANEEIKDTQNKLLQSEKMATVGQLAAGVAHEINNPIGFINSNIQTLEDYLKSYFEVLKKVEEISGSIKEQDLEKAQQLNDELNTLKDKLSIDFIIEDVKNLVAESKEGIDRVKKIVMDLRSFSAADKDKMDEVDIRGVVDGVLNIVNNEIKYKAEVVKDYKEVPPVKCNAQRMGQVFINLLVNASQAIEERGEIQIKIYPNTENVCIELIDNGKGISKEDLSKIFDPFFTTKEVGMGTGLGLGICYDIVKSHNGEIDVQSEVGKGTRFLIKLPMTRKKEKINVLEGKKNENIS